MKRIILLTALFLVAVTTQAQKFSLGADLVSSYVWRGFNFGGTSIQPSIGFEAGNFSIGAWGSVNASDFQSYKEFDLTAGYRFSGISIAVTDYWIAQEGTSSYFNYNKDKGTAHTFEASLGYALPIAKFPLSLSWNTNFAGIDGLKSNGKTAWSSYFELSCPFDIKDVALTAALGLTPWETDYYSAGSFAVINVSLKAVKEIKISELHLPLFVQLVLNPRTENAFLVFGVSF